MAYVGYTPEALLPFQKGQRVRVRKGATVSSTHPDPARRQYTLARAQWVKVDHVLPGMSRLLWRGYPDTEGLLVQVRPHDLEALCSQYETDVKGLLSRCVPAKHVSHTDWYLPVQNPSIRWTGTGGYWNEVDVNKVG